MSASGITNNLSVIQHARHFWYAVVLVLKCYAVAWSLRASHLNWALGFSSSNINRGDSRLCLSN